MRVIKSIDEKHRVEALNLVKELVDDALEEMFGEVEYSFYEMLR